jgi:hypothetical protein
MDELFLHQVPVDTEIPTSITLLNFYTPYPQKSMFCSLSNHFTGVSVINHFEQVVSWILLQRWKHMNLYRVYTMQPNVNHVFYFLYFSLFKYSKNVVNNV